MQEYNIIQNLTKRARSVRQMQASIDGELTEMEQAIESLIYDADSLNVILAHVQSKEENKAGNRTLKGEA